MVKSFKAFIAGFLTCSLLMGGIVAVAAGDTQIKATLLNTFKMKLYGSDYTVKDSTGAVLKPILYNKTAYIPVQAIVKGLGIPVEYDTAGKTVWLGGKMTKVPVDSATVYKDYYASTITKDPAKLSTPDKNYKWGITNPKTLDMDTFGCYLTPSSRYNKFKASLYIDAEVKMPLTVQFLKDNYNSGVSLATYELQPGVTQEVEFDIGGVEKFYIMSNIRIGHGVVKSLVIGEPVFFNEKPEAESNATSPAVIK